MMKKSLKTGNLNHMQRALKERSSSPLTLDFPAAFALLLMRCKRSPSYTALTQSFLLTGVHVCMPALTITNTIVYMCQYRRPAVREENLWCRGGVANTYDLIILWLQVE